MVILFTLTVVEIALFFLGYCALIPVLKKYEEQEKGPYSKLISIFGLIYLYAIVLQIVTLIYLK